MNEVAKKIISYHSMIDLIRFRKECDTTVEVLKDTLQISRTTADKMYASLLGKDDGCPILERQERRTLIRRDVGYFLGISLGSSHMRVILLDLSFEPVPCWKIETYPELKDLRSVGDYKPEESNDHSYAFRTPSDPADTFGRIREVISGIVSRFLRQAEQSGSHGFPLMGIGFAVAGPVDYEAGLWCSAPRLTSVKNLTIYDLIGYENQNRIDSQEIFLSLDNNSKTSIISEYQYLLEKNRGQYKEDVALIYIGSGVGSAVVLNQTLLRGSHNLSGEIGHIRIANAESPELTSNEKTLENYLKDPSKYTQYLPNILNTLNCILGIDRFILVGHSVAANDTWIPALMDQRIKFTVSSTQQYCTAQIGRQDPCTAAIGAAMEAYFSMCAYDMENGEGERTNLATEVSWKVRRG